MSGKPHVDSESSRPDWEALARYLSGEASAAEAQRMQRWLEAHPEEAALLSALDRTQPPALRNDIDVEAALRRVSARIARDAPERAMRIEPGRPAWPLLRTGLAAAAVIGAVAAIALFRELTKRAPVTQTLAARTFTTAVGQRDSVHLSDGTRVMLGPVSRMIVDAGYGSENRRVELEGEAFFEVAHDADSPFIVEAGRAHIEDVGTAFTVRTAEGNNVLVAVTEGAVLLRATNEAADPGVLLQPGDRGVVQAGGLASAQPGAVSAQDTAWRRGRLVFRDAPLAEVRSGLRRWYGVELRLADSALARRHLTATFEGEPIDQVLRVIGLALGASVERRADTAIVRLTPAARSP